MNQAMKIWSKSWRKYKPTQKKILVSILSLSVLFSIASFSVTILAENLYMIGQLKKYGIGCIPTHPDSLGPFYKPNAPLRSSVGRGYRLSGMVLSSKNCSPIPQALIEFWMAGPDGEYKDDYRAVVISDESGEYQFESHFPPSYSQRPPHIHIRATAHGFKTLTTQHYPRNGSTRGEFDLVLIPD
jgi:protocatechuate 3,4-dioxygenase beta subunit